MKRKGAALCLALALALSTAACGNTEATPEEKAPAVTEVIEEAAEEPSENTEEIAEEPAVQTESAIPHPRTTSFHEYAETDDGMRTLMYVNAELMGLTKESEALYPALAESLSALKGEQIQTFREELRTKKEWAKEQYEYEGDDFYPYNDNEHLVVTRCDDRVLSFVSEYSGYYGGAHGFYGTTGYQFDVKTGKTLTVADLFTDTGALNETLKEKLYEKYPEYAEEFESFDIDDTLEKMRTGEDDYGYEIYLTPQGITFYFDSYDLTSYASGAQEVTLPYNEVRGSLNPAYLPADDAPWYYEFQGGENSGFLWDIDGDDLQDYILLDGSIPDENGFTLDEYGMYRGISLTVGGETLTLGGGEESYYYSLIGRIYRDSAGHIFITATGTMDNDYAETFVCKYENGSLTETDNCWLRATTYANAEDPDRYETEIPVDPGKLRLSQHFDLLSTYMAAKTYALSPEGKLVSEDPYYQISSAGRYDLVLKKALTADVVAEDGQSTGESVTLSAGAHLSLYRTDGAVAEGEIAAVDLKDEDGQILRLYVTPDYPHQVNGEDEFDLFETLYYAG